ncbi:MAG: N-glycosylase/DNA lyase [Candidatus Tantalella remota]|nr:N-glycosylase/DNA lyase [Candidatus Tantalella remota]
MKKALAGEYQRQKRAIKKRLKEFEAVWGESEKRIFSELCFCICTPQSSAIQCDKAVAGLVKSGVLYKGSAEQIRVGLKAVRFPNNKARYIVETRDLFTEKRGIRIKGRIDEDDIPATRHWLVRNVKGIGFKEASHFLRNIGFGRDLAILDVHILKNMIRFGIIKEVPKTLTEKRYLSLEGRLRRFSDRIGIPMVELDLLFWSAETGVIFK